MLAARAPRRAAALQVLWKPRLYVPRSCRAPLRGGAAALLQPGLTGHFAFHRNSAIPTVILGGNDSFHFAFHPEKDGNVRMAGLSSLQKMEISIL
jgi:hypothetical protein